MPARSTPTLTIASANLLHGRRLHDGGICDDDLRAAARLLDADVVGVQEADLGQPRSSGSDQLAVVADELGGCTRLFVPTQLGVAGSAQWRPASRADDLPPRRSGQATYDSAGERPEPAYGIGLITRHPVLRWRVWRFPASKLGLPLLVPGSLAGTSKARLRVTSDEARAGIAAVLDLPGGPVTVATTHLSFVPGPNIGQLRALAAGLRDLPAPRFLFGDVNLPGAIPRLACGWQRLATVATYPSWAAVVQFDHLLASGLDPGTRAVDVSTVALPVSDHLALRAVIQLPER